MKELVSNVQGKKISAKELTQSALDNIEKFDGEINAFCSINPEDALLQAEQIDSAIIKGEEVGILAGIPIGVKDLEDAKGFITSFGSELHINDAPANEDSILVQRMRDQGCVILGKTNTPEFGHKGKQTIYLSGPLKIHGIFNILPVAHQVELQQHWRQE